MCDPNAQLERFTDWIEWPHSHLRVEIDKVRGTPVQFTVQLEYRLVNDNRATIDDLRDDRDEGRLGEWVPVVRFDHSSEGEMSHDIREEGLHMDIYRDGRKHLVKEDFPSVPLLHAVHYCETYIQDNADQLLRRFEQWHDLTTPQ